MSASCCGSSRKTAALVVMAAALGGVALWLAQLTRPTPHEVPPVEETVEVLVAAKDLPRGTFLTEERIRTAVVSQRFPRDQVPKGAVAEVGALRDRRLRFAVLRGGPIPAASLSGKPSTPLAPGEDILSMPVHPSRSPRIAAGARVDIVVAQTDGVRPNAFTLIQDIEVIDIGPLADDIICCGCSDWDFASFVVTPKLALLVALANQVNGNLEFVPRRPDDPVPSWDYDATLARLQRLAKEAAEPEPEVAPFPRAVP